jgi:two-component system chemotaxis response regulator CheY
VDDDADLRAYLARGLRGLGAVVEADDGLAALAVLAARTVDLVVTDLAMPRLDGRALCHAMQADPALAAVPVLVITGEVGAAVPGARATLAKPFNARTLRERAVPLLRDALTG